MNPNYSKVYFMQKGDDFKEFWKEYLGQGTKKLLFIFGLSFDPRTLDCLKIILKTMSTSTLELRTIRYDNTISQKSHIDKLLDQNIKDLQSLIPSKKWNEKIIHIVEDECVSSIDAIKIIKESNLEKYTDIVVDVSAMPNDVYFPITKEIFDLVNSEKIKQTNGKKINLHLVVSENAMLDGQIKETDISEKAIFMHKFDINIQRESKKHLSKIWIPLLGEYKKLQLERTHIEISPEEILPVFPTPSTNPYRAKHLLLEYRELLIDSMSIDPRNFVYANEQNPFDAYRKIYDTAKYSFESFEPLGGCHVVLSAFSSKLLCVGCLLAACDLSSDDCNISIAYVKNQTFDLEIKNQTSNKSIPFTLWLAGECYDE